jgi:hypothetical protein
MQRDAGCQTAQNGPGRGRRSPMREEKVQALSFVAIQPSSLPGARCVIHCFAAGSAEPVLPPGEAVNLSLP